MKHRKIPVSHCMIFYFAYWFSNTELERFEHSDATRLKKREDNLHRITSGNQNTVDTGSAWVGLDGAIAPPRSYVWHTESCNYLYLAAASMHLNHMGESTLFTSSAKYLLKGALWGFHVNKQKLKVYFFEISEIIVYIHVCYWSSYFLPFRVHCCGS